MAPTSTKQNLKTSVAPISGIKALMGAAGHKYEDFTYGDVKVPMRAVTVQQMLRLCREHPSLLDVFEGINITKAILEAGDEAVASVIAFACDAEGDEEFRQWLLTAPDDVVTELVLFALEITFGSEPPDVFFQKLLQRLEALEMFKPRLAEAA